MEIEFETKKLYRLYLGEVKVKNLPNQVIDKYKKTIDYIAEAENINELSNLKSLNIEKIDKELWSARLNKQFRLIFKFIKPNTVVINKISKHYEDI